MYTNLYNDFLSSDDTLRVYDGDRQVFSSKKERLLPLMDYIATVNNNASQVTIFDKVMGNAAALLSTKANAREVFSPLGSELAIKTLEKSGITYHLTVTVPFILRPDGVRMCPMEELSIGKEPEEFYRELKARIETDRLADSG
jgi:protein associated with RNAse G/E